MAGQTVTVESILAQAQQDKEGRDMLNLFVRTVLEILSNFASDSELKKQVEIGAPHGQWVVVLASAQPHISFQPIRGRPMGWREGHPDPRIPSHLIHLVGLSIADLLDGARELYPSANEGFRRYALPAQSSAE